MKKKLVSLLLALGLCVGLATPVGASVDMRATGEYNKVSCSDQRFTAAIDDSGTLWMMGSNRYGVFGLGIDYDQMPYSATPVKVMDDVLSVSCGFDFVAALKSDGSLWTWGYNNLGALGNGFTGNAGSGTNIYQTVPMKIMDDVAYAECFGTHCAAIKKDGSLWMWGNVADNVLGNGFTWDRNIGSTAAQTVPVKILDDVKIVRSCNTHTAAIKTDGSLWMWGCNEHGELGTNGAYDMELGQNEPLKQQSVPVKVMDHVANVFCSPGYTVIIKDDNSVWGCGHLNDTLRKSSLVPVKLPLSDIAFYGGNFYLKTDGSLWELVADLDHPGGYLEKIMDNVDAFSYTTYALYYIAVRTDHTLWAWGRNSDGQLGIPKDKVGINEQKVPIKVMDNIALSGSAPAPETSAGFSDVPADSPFKDAIAWAVEQKITNGTSETTFGPSNTCTHNHILTFLWRANGSPAAEGANDFAKAAAWAKAKGLADTIDGDAACTRSQTVMYLWKLAGSPETAVNGKFTDVAANAEYAQAVAWAVEQGITSGTSQTTFSPDRICTRGQIVTFLYRAYAK